MRMKTNPSSLGTQERDLFLATLEILNREDRSRFLKSACGADSELYRRVEALLLDEEQLGSFLSSPALSAQTLRNATAGTEGEYSGMPMSPPEGVGQRIGRYKLLQEIGEGGWGVVYMAEQEEPVRRKVALKVIKAGMDTKSVIARFEAERQAIALMDHANIARVFDAGATESGRPFFVMELVRGIRITAYCDQNRLSTRQRLELFVKVCRAIQHAHQKGIIHRDIKPSNILVTLNDGVPEPKVIDFGIAKATDQRLTDKTLFTAFEHFIGTPAYMSPEQAEMSGLGIDTRSDIYSLGVLLYEMLTGRPPFDGKELAESGLHAMRRTIRETDPPRPSTRLKTLEMAEVRDLVAQRKEELPVLLELFRGDLDWIVMKAVAKDRALRYESADALGTDVRRYLDGEEVLARAPSRSYRIQKFVHRNRLLVSSGLTVVAILALATAVSTWQALRATRAEREQGKLLLVTEAARREESNQRDRAERERLIALRRAYNADMNLIPQALQAENYGRVIRLLNQHNPKPTAGPELALSENEPDFRQWEWRYFRTQAQSDAAFVLPRQPGVIQGLAISSDARFVASQDRNGTLKLWDLFRRIELTTLTDAGVQNGPFAFSPKGDQLAATREQDPEQPTVTVWSTSTRQVTEEIPIDTPIQALAYSPDGDRLLLLGEDKSIRSWSFRAGRMKLHSVGQNSDEEPMLQGFPAAVFSSDGKLVAYTRGNRVEVREVETGAEKCSLTAFEFGVACLAFSPNTDLIAASPLFSEAETDIKLYSAHTGKAAGRLIGHSAWVPGMTFSPDGTRLISTGADQTVRIWNLANRQEITTLRGHLSEARAVVLSGDGKTIVTGGKDGSLFGWDAEHVERRKRFEILPVTVGSLGFFPNSRSMLSVNRDGTVALWDTTTLQELERVHALGSNVNRLVLSPDGERVFATTYDDKLMVLDWPHRTVVTNVVLGTSRRSRAIPVGTTDGGRTLITSDRESSIRLWNTTAWSYKNLVKMGSSQPIRGPALALSADTTRLAVLTANNQIEVLNLTEGRTEASFSIEGLQCAGVAFSPDNRLLAAAFVDGFVKLWNIPSATAVDVLQGHLQGVRDVAFSPDGERLASASARAEAVKLWDVQLRHDVATFAGEGSLFKSVQFSPDGRLLAAISAQGKAHVWRAPSLQEIGRLESTIR